MQANEGATVASTEPPGAPPSAQSGPPIRIVWQWQPYLDEWETFSPELAKQLEAAFTAGQAYTEIETKREGLVQVKFAPTWVQIDRYGLSRRVRRHELPPLDTVIPTADPEKGLKPWQTVEGDFVMVSTADERLKPFGFVADQRVRGRLGYATIIGAAPNPRSTEPDAEGLWVQWDVEEGARWYRDPRDAALYSLTDFDHERLSNIGGTGAAPGATGAVAGGATTIWCPSCGTYHPAAPLGGLGAPNFAPALGLGQNSLYGRFPESRFEAERESARKKAEEEERLKKEKEEADRAQQEIKANFERMVSMRSNTEEEKEEPEAEEVEELEFECEEFEGGDDVDDDEEEAEQ